jgi:uncharacterized protein (TIGR02646 family)
VRHIVVPEEWFPADWLSAATSIREKVAGVESDSRSNEIKENSEWWRKAKPWLEALSHGKCWYCESKNDRSDNAVDHFRPKSSSAAEGGGYWWLAFDPSNLRFSCTFCNSFRNSHRGTSGGKQDHFPLWDEIERVRSPEEDLRRERPLLLDPKVDGDPDHLWFQLDGTVVPSEWTGASGSYPHTRAKVSIKLYHLDEPSLCERRKQVRRQVTDEVRDAQDAISLYAGGDERGRRIISGALKRIREMSAPSAELSAVVRCALLELQGEFPFAARAIQACL